MADLGFWIIVTILGAIAAIFIRQAREQDQMSVSGSLPARSRLAPDSASTCPEASESGPASLAHEVAYWRRYGSLGQERYEFWCSCERFHMTGLNSYEAIQPVLVAHREIERSLAPFNEAR